MAMRRVARQSLHWTERPAIAPAAAYAHATPTASTSRSLSHAVSLDSTVHTAQHDRPQHLQHAWNAAASHAIFGAQPREQEQATSAVGTQRQLDHTVDSLIQELKRVKPDPARCWTLFHNADQAGLAPTIPTISLHALLSAIHTPAPRTLTIERSTALARDYQARVDLIRMRLAQAGGATTPGDWKALLEQYRAFRYAPGILRTWDEMITAGDAPTPQKCRLVFETLAAWIELHGREAGRAVERTAALPLAKQATRILLNDIGLERSSHIIDQAVEPYLEVVAKAGYFALLTKAVKALYGFDIRLPGALVDVKAAQRAQLRTLGARELDWILVGLGQANELSTMVAVFETFDSPDPSTIAPSAAAAADPASFFSSTFSNLSLSSPEVDTQPVRPATRESQAHLIGTRALQTMVATAARLNQPALVRHYFDLLFCRWEAGANDLIAQWEQATGVAPAQAPATDAAPPAPWLGSPFAHSLTSIKHRHLTRAPSAPAQPYRLPVSLAMLVSQYSYINYQAATSKWNRIRTKRIVQVLEAQAGRLERVLEKLEPTESAAAASSATEPVASTSAAPAPAVSLARVLREFRKVTADLHLLRETLATVKHNNRIVHSWDTRHSQQYELSLIRRKSAHLARSTSRRGGTASTASTKEERLRLDRLEAKRARKVDIWTARLAKHRIEKMVKVEGRGAGDRRFDAELKKLVELREKLVPGHAAAAQGAGPRDELTSA
ncbi:hypothetical protein JCM10908_000295 [Rhodotorula pacifica]|uniref:uncharacterized protein n=1 Tax=Rhodotorula pacifica TaxID=1495444 RepID=UPI00317E90D0